MNRIRRDKMKNYIEQEKVVTIRQIQALFPDVSLMTVHRDLDVLEQEGYIVKFRGGAKAVRHAVDPEFNVRMGENNAGKMKWYGCYTNYDFFSSSFKKNSTDE